MAGSDADRPRVRIIEELNPSPLWLGRKQHPVARTRKFRGTIPVASCNAPAGSRDPESPSIEVKQSYHTTLNEDGHMYTHIHVTYISTQIDRLA